MRFFSGKYEKIFCYYEIFFGFSQGFKMALGAFLLIPFIYLHQAASKRSQGYFDGLGEPNNLNWILFSKLINRHKNSFANLANLAFPVIVRSFSFF